MAFQVAKKRAEVFSLWIAVIATVTKLETISLGSVKSALFMSLF